MKGIHINYAYDGFLYAPLFLAARHLHLFPENMEPKGRGGDIQTIMALANKFDEKHNWFAICDPFAKDISKVQSKIGPDDDIVIIGVLIERLPMWLHTNHPDIEVIREADLKKYSQQIQKVRCYKRFNTGYLVGRRVMKYGEFDENKLQEVELGAEFASLPKNGEYVLTVTSDVVTVAQDSDNTKNIVFDYAAKCNDLNPFLFTAVLTLKSVIDQHLEVVLSLLGGLREATAELSSSYTRPEYIDFLTTEFGTRLDPHRAKGIVERSVHILFKEEKVFSNGFELDRARRAYEIAKKEWMKVVEEGHEFPDIEAYNDPIPSLLIKQGWRKDQSVVKAFAGEWKAHRPLIRVAGEIWRGEPTAVAEVADCWRDDPEAVSVAADSWAEHQTSLTALRSKICPQVAEPTSRRLAPDSKALGGLVAAVVVACVAFKLQMDEQGQERIWTVVEWLFWSAQFGLIAWMFRELSEYKEKTGSKLEKIFGGVIAAFGLQLALILHVFVHHGSSAK